MSSVLRTVGTLGGLLGGGSSTPSYQPGQVQMGSLFTQGQYPIAASELEEHRKMLEKKGFFPPDSIQWPSVSAPNLKVGQVNLPAAGPGIGTIGLPSIPNIGTTNMGQTPTIGGIDVGQAPGNTLEAGQLANWQQLNPLALKTAQEMAAVAGVPGAGAPAQASAFSTPEIQSILGSSVRNLQPQINTASNERAATLMSQGINASEARSAANRWGADELNKARLDAMADLGVASIGRRESQLANTLAALQSLMPSKLTTTSPMDVANLQTQRQMFDASQAASANQALAQLNTQRQMFDVSNQADLATQLAQLNTQRQMYDTSRADDYNRMVAEIEANRAFTEYGASQDWASRLAEMGWQQELAAMSALGQNRIFDYSRMNDYWKALQQMASQLP